MSRLAPSGKTIAAVDVAEGNLDGYFSTPLAANVPATLIVGFPAELLSAA